MKTPPGRVAFPHQKWWTLSQRIRTSAQITIEISLIKTEVLPVYMQLSPKVEHLSQLGLSMASISRRLGIDWKTVKRALTLFRS